MSNIPEFDYFLENSKALHEEAKNINSSASLSGFKKKILVKAQEALIVLERRFFQQYNVLHTYYGDTVYEPKNNLYCNLCCRKRSKRLLSDTDKSYSVQLGKTSSPIFHTNIGPLLTKNAGLYRNSLSTVIEYRVIEKKGFVYKAGDGNVYASDGQLLFVDAISIGYYREPYCGQNVVYLPYSKNKALDCLVIGERRFGYVFSGKKHMLMNDTEKIMSMRKEFNGEREVSLNISSMAMSFKNALNLDNFFPSNLKEDFYEVVNRFNYYDAGDCHGDDKIYYFN